MRISSTQINQQGINAILDQQAQLSKTQLQLSTGRRVVTPADDPAASARALGLAQAVAGTQQYQSNVDVAQGRLNLEEGALSGAGNLLQDVRVLALQANNASLSNGDRTAIANEVRQRLDELLALANSRDAGGEYLFAGYKGQTQPFSQNSSGGFIYNGDQGQRYLQIGPTRQIAVSDSGTDVFQAIRNGNGTFTTKDNAANTGSGIINTGTVVNPTAYQAHNFTITFTSATTFDVVNNTTATTILSAQPYTSGAAISFNGIQTAITGTPATGDSFAVTPSANQDVFTTLQNLANALAAPVTGGSTAKLNNAVNRSLVDIDQALGNILDVRARVGARLNAVESQKNINEDFALLTETSLSKLQDLDYSEAASRLNLQRTALEAAQLAFVKVQGLSLFNFLR